MKKIEIETDIIQSSQSKNRKIKVQNLSQRIFFQEQVKFSKIGHLVSILQCIKQRRQVIDRRRQLPLACREFS